MRTVLRHAADAAIEAQGLRKSFGDVQALDGDRPARADRHGPRAARPERRRQDHRGPHPHHAARRPTAARARVAGLDVVRDAADAARATSASPASTRRSTRTSPASRTSRWSGASTTCGRRPARERARELLERFALTDAARPPGEDLLRRHAPPARPRRRARGAPAGAVPRRAHHRARPAQPPRALGDDRGARGRGHDRPAHHAVPRRGRPAGRPHRRDRPRPGDRRGHAPTS